MSYIAKFYNYPFTYGARRVYAPASKVARENFLNPRLIKQISVDTPFYEGQGKIYAEYESELTGANYVQIITAYEERFYFIHNAAIIEPAEGGTATIEFTLVEDVWQTHFFKWSEGATETGTGFDYARLLNTSIKNFISDPKLPRDFLYRDAVTQYTPLFSSNEPWVFVMIVTTQTGKFYALAQRFDNFIAGAVTGAEAYTRAAQYDGGTGTWENITITKQFYFPSAILGGALPETYTPAHIKIVNNEGQIEDKTYPCYNLISGLFENTVSKYLPSSIINGVPHKTTVVTASKEVSFLQVPPEVSKVYFTVCAAGAYANSLVIYMTVNGERYDITNDFMFDRAANYKALQRAYEGNAAYFTDIAAAIGGIGGAIGGIVSGNYFGAVQSVVSTAGHFVNRAAELNTPAAVQYSSNATACLFAFNGIATLDYGTPDNAHDIQRAIKYEGYAVQDYTAGIPAEILKNAALRVESAEVFGVDAEAAAVILEDLKRGVYFDDGTA